MLNSHWTALRIIVIYCLILTSSLKTLADAPSPNYSSILSKKEIRRQKRAERRKLRKIRRQQRRIKRLKNFLNSRFGRWVLRKFAKKNIGLCSLIPHETSREEYLRVGVCSLFWLLISGVVFGLVAIIARAGAGMGLLAPAMMLILAMLALSLNALYHFVVALFL